MNDIDKAEDRMLDEEDSFDLDDDFNPLLPIIFKGYITHGTFANC